MLNLGLHPVVEAAYNDGQPIEPGVRFQSSTGGYITGIRFYKGVTAAGQYTGKLYSNSGTLLATVTFPSSTSTGWQEALFTTPVAIDPNVTYVASYFSQSGDYVATGGSSLQAAVSVIRRYSRCRMVWMGRMASTTTARLASRPPLLTLPTTGWMWSLIPPCPNDTTPPVISAVNATPGVDGTTATDHLDDR